MPRGGRRQGRVGTAYASRSDLNTAAPLPVQAATGQAYGEAGNQMAAQRALPMARPATDAVRPAAPRIASGAARPAMPSGPMPGQLMRLDAPSQRPDEPVTAGLPVGPGPGREALGPLAGARETVGDELRAIYARFPTEELREMIEDLDGD